ncbi:DUF4389 domain-containing protein [candidate division KSB1 bacterium]|nr:DUF4389 domain-containing protein [candidate division KSB1 bacterium]
MAESNLNYPATLTIDYPEQADRLTSFFRIFTALPILLILGILVGSNEGWGHEYGRRLISNGGGIVVIPTLLMLLFRQKYPRWWFDWNLALTRFCTRVAAYLLLLTHEYPSTDEDQRVHLEIPYPDAARDLKRALPLIKWLLVLPHIIILALLMIAVLAVTFIAWFAILFTGRYPKSLFDFVVGVLRWWLRVEAYALLLTTDVYPPFSLN